MLRVLLNFSTSHFSVGGNPDVSTCSFIRYEVGSSLISRSFYNFDLHRCRFQICEKLDANVLGIIGYLHLWGVHLDAVSLISILMSVGFSVDYSAHVCYHYFAHAHEDEKQVFFAFPL